MGIGSALVAAGSSLLGGLFGDKNKDKDRQLQKDFAQQGIRWKVEDAKKAGIHPLYALGAQTHSFAPVSVGDPGLGQGLAQAGQDISRAMDATRTGGERLQAYDKTVRDLQLTRMGLENELLSAQIANVRQPGTGPAMPGSGVMVGGVPFNPDLKWSNAQTAEDRWGELADFIYGPFVANADVAKAGYSPYHLGQRARQWLLGE